jgi:hypothetical protein
MLGFSPSSTSVLGNINELLRIYLNKLNELLFSKVETRILVQGTNLQLKIITRTQEI